MGRRKEERSFILRGIGFSEKERQVADLDAEGEPNGSIAKRLNMAPSSIYNMLSHGHTDRSLPYRVGVNSHVAFRHWWREANEEKNALTYASVDFFSEQLNLASKMSWEGDYRNAQALLHIVGHGLRDYLSIQPGGAKEKELSRLLAKVILEKWRISVDQIPLYRAIANMKQECKYVTEIAQRNNDAEIIALMNLRFGLAYSIHGEHTEALRFLEKARPNLRERRDILLSHRFHMLSIAFNPEIELTQKRMKCKETWEKAQGYLDEATQNQESIAFVFIGGYGRVLCTLKDEKGMEILLFELPRIAEKTRIPESNYILKIRRCRDIVEGAEPLHLLKESFVEAAQVQGERLSNVYDIMRYVNFFAISQMKLAKRF